jgi:hypothetical protein
VATKELSHEKLLMTAGFGICETNWSAWNLPPALFSVDRPPARRPVNANRAFCISSALTKQAVFLSLWWSTPIVEWLPRDTGFKVNLGIAPGSALSPDGIFPGARPRTHFRAVLVCRHVPLNAQSAACDSASTFDLQNEAIAQSRAG